MTAVALSSLDGSERAAVPLDLVFIPPGHAVWVVGTETHDLAVGA